MEASKIKISYADKSHINALKEIWHECFGDSFRYIYFFFENRFDSCKTMIASYDGKTVGAAYLMPVKTYEYGVLKNGWYGYAIGILKEYRKNGIYAMMHEKIMNDINAKNEFYILCPANQKLCEYYSSLGFTEFSYLNSVKIPKCSTECIITSEKITAQRYTQLRNEYFPSDGFILWDEKAIEYAICENDFCGGFTSEITLNGKTFVLMARPLENGVKITESTVAERYLKDVTAYLCQRYGFDYAVWTRAAYELPNGNSFLSGMSCNLKKSETAYLNMVLN